MRPRRARRESGTAYLRRWPDDQARELISAAAKQAADMLMDDAEMAADAALDEGSDSAHPGDSAAAWIEEVFQSGPRVVQAFADDLMGHIRSQVVETAEISRPLAGISITARSDATDDAAKWAKDRAG